MFTYIWPIALVIFSNILYQVCAKGVSSEMNPLASMTVTYFVSTIASAILYFLLVKDGHLLKEYTHTNWAPIVLGLVIVGLEVGFIYAYKIGWQVSTASTVQSAFLAVALLIVGFVFYHEPLSASKIFGAVVCLIGLYFLNR